MSLLRLMFIVAMTLCSCSHKELCYDHSHIIEVEVSFDWSKAPEASPETMSLYLFPMDGGKVQRYEFTDFRGGRMRVGEGEYKAICLNSDTRNLRLRDTDRYETFQIVTKDSELHSLMSSLVSTKTDGPPRAKGTEDERVAEEPEYLWTGNLNNLVLKSDDDNFVVAMRETFTAFDVRIKNMDNIEYAYMLSAALTTLSEGYYPGKGELSEENVTIPFSLSFPADDGDAEGSFRAFGHCPFEDKRHFLTVYATMVDGSNVSFTYDVTEQVHAGDLDEILIVIDDLILPEPERGDVEEGGLKPSVGEWNAVEIGLKM